MMLVFFCAAFSFAVGVRDYFPREPWSERVDYIRSNPMIEGRPVEVVFIGSSRIENGFNPRVFDRVMKEHNVDLGPSYALGSGASKMYQNKYMAERLLGGKIAPRFVIIEASDFESWVPEDGNPQGWEARLADWHDFRNTWLVLGTVLAESRLIEGTSRERLTFIKEGFQTHLLYLVDHYAPTGDILRLIERRREQFDEEQAEEEFRQTRGYMGVWTYESSIFRPFREQPEKWDRLVEMVHRYETTRKAVPPLNLESFLELHRAVEKAGAKLIYLATPSGARNKRDSAPYWWLEDKGLISPELQDGKPLFLNGYNNPEKYPEFFDIDIRWDESHLTEEGVELLVETVAHDFIRIFYPEHDGPCEWKRARGRAGDAVVSRGA